MSGSGPSSHRLDLRSFEEARPAIPSRRAPSVSVPPPATPPSRRPRPRPPRFVMHSASLGILAGLAAVVWIAFLVPHQTSRNASPTTAGGSAEAATDSAEAAGSSAHGGAVAARPADRLKIPQLGVNAPVITVGLLPGGAMDAPKTLWQVGWYKNSAKPGGTGTAIIDGHAGAPNQVGVLENLNRLRTGDKFSYAYLDGRTINFRVTSSKAYPLNTDTIAKLYSPTGPKSLNLISCYGKYNSQTNDYAQRWIVTAVTD